MTRTLLVSPDQPGACLSIGDPVTAVKADALIAVVEGAANRHGTFGPAEEDVR